MVKRFALCLLVLALATPALATNYLNYPEALMRSPYSYGYVTNTFFQCEGDSVLFRYGPSGPAVQDTAAAIGTIDPDGNPGWLLVDFEEEAATLTAWFQFFESTDGSTHSFTAGDWVPIRMDGAATQAAFNVGLWDSCHVVITGSSCGNVRCFWRVENISD